MSVNMWAHRRVASPLLSAALIVAAFAIWPRAQERGEKPVPKPTLPNPYRLDPDWPTLPTTMHGPNGHKWGEVIRVHVAPNGNVWVFHRCFYDKPAGDATCVNRGDVNPPILEFNPAGKLLRSFGVGLFAHPHGFAVDKDGNIWTTDTNDEQSVLGIPAKDAKGGTLGQAVLKISPQGKVLMTIGTPGVGGIGPYTFDRPTGVSVASNGDIFVADGHSGNKSNSGRIVKYSADGKFIKTWGRLGSEPGNFREPHDLFVGGSKGYVYVADRQNNRIQVFNQDGDFIAAWKQFGQPSSVFVDTRDNIYVGATYQDPARGNVMRATTAPNDRAIVIGNAITGELKYLIPDPGDLSKMTDTGTSASGIAVDAQGNIFAADVGFNNLRKYVRAAGGAAPPRD
ncbi:MAG TPA: peptidyl-alpha-hydroxyglycine alpha-amidating lyase family protein [Vicinamibacterales bacterium]